MAHPPRSKPPLRSSSGPPNPCITPSTETFVVVVNLTSWSPPRTTAADPLLDPRYLLKTSTLRSVYQRGTIASCVLGSTASSAVSRSAQVLGQRWTILNGESPVIKY